MIEQTNLQKEQQELKKQIKKDLRKLLLTEFRTLNEVLTSPLTNSNAVLNASMNYNKISQFSKKYFNTYRTDELKHYLMEKYNGKLK
jgi:hypothetical protein